MTNQMITTSKPSFLSTERPKGAEELMKVVVPPRLKMVQKSAGKPFSDEFNVGDMVLVPQMIRLAPVILGANGKPTEKGEVFKFTPIFWWREWCYLNPVEDKSGMIIERTFDENHEIARRSADPKHRTEPHPTIPGKFRKFSLFINHMIVVHGVPELKNLPILLPFFHGSMRAGQNFSMLLRMREADIFGCKFQCNSQWTSNNDGDWYFPDVKNPADGDSWVTDEEDYKNYGLFHEQFKQLHASKALVADYDDPSEQDAKSEF